MNTKITITLFTVASLLLAKSIANAQTCGTSQVTYSGYTSGYLPKWNATSGCINNSSIFDNGEVGIGLTAPASRFHSAGQIRSGIPSGGLGGASATTGALLFYNASNSNTVNIQSGVTTTSYSMTLPPAQGAASSVLTNNGSGGLDWLNIGIFWEHGGNTLTGTLPASPLEFIGTLNAADWIIRTNNTEKMRVQSGGNVGIGTTTPIKILDILKSQNAQTEVRLSNLTSGTGSAALYTANSDAASAQFGQVSSSCTPYGSLGANYGFMYTNSPGLNIMADNASGIINFATGGNTEKMRISSTGNVGIGTTSPAVKLDVNGGAQISNGLYLNGNSVNGGSSSLILGNSSSAENYSLSVGTPNGVETGLSINKLSSYTVGGAIQYSASEFLRITNAGNVGIGTTAPSYTLDVTGTARVTTRAGIGAAPNASYDLYLQNSAYIASGTWGGSDIRIKKDTSSFTDGLNMIKKIHPISFRYNGKTGITDTNQLYVSMVAQQLQNIAPYAVKPFSVRLNNPNDTTEAPTQILSINTQPLLFACINAIKELAKSDSIKDTRIKDMQTADSVLNAKLQTRDTTIQVMQNQINQKDLLNTTMFQMMQNQINQLDSMINSCCSLGSTRSMHLNSDSQISDSQVINSKDIELVNRQVVVLFQNSPNPFKEQTTIEYYLPDNVQRAQIIFLEQSGKLIKTVDFTEKGKGVLNVFANDLTNGIYTYSLIVDGQTIETKKMVKTK